MKATELRIGNYVKDPYSKEIRLVSVEKDASMLRPIPLTEEWLLKFGFKKLDKYTFTLNSWFIYRRKRGFVTGSKRREIKLNSIHELQNWWFANTKKEL
jgi:hypothetical protein